MMKLNGTIRISPRNLTEVRLVKLQGMLTAVAKYGEDTDVIVGEEPEKITITYTNAYCNQRTLEDILQECMKDYRDNVDLIDVVLSKKKTPSLNNDKRNNKAINRESTITGSYFYDSQKDMSNILMHMQLAHDVSFELS